MTEIKVAVLGASRWMGEVHTMGYLTFCRLETDGFRIGKGRPEITRIRDLIRP